MSEKTDTYVPKFYLFHQEQPICISKPMIVGRTIGDVVLDNSKLSAKHCAFFPRLLELYIMDLESSNGVFVNKQKIFPNEEIKLNPGDEIRIGDMEFIVFDSEEKYKAHLQAFKDNIVQKDETFKLTDVVTFFHVSKNWRCIYSLAILLAITSTVYHSQLGIPVHDDIKFISNTYTEVLILNGLRSLLLVWAFCLLHAYLVKKYFIFHKFQNLLSGIPFLAAVYFSVNFYYGPAGFIKQYMEVRHNVFEPIKESKGINQLKKLTEAQILLGKNFGKIISKLNQTEKKIFIEDNSRTLSHLATKMDEVKSND